MSFETWLDWGRGICINFYYSLFTHTHSTWYKTGVGASVELALKTGYHLIDCAFVYLNEAEVGNTLQSCFKSSIAKREDIFITSKLWYIRS